MSAPDNIFGLAIPFGQFLGIEPLEQGNGLARTALNLKPEYMNSWATAHGGALMTLLDLTMGMASRSLDPTSMGAITIEMKTNFLAAARGRITAEGRATPCGRTLVYAEGEIRDDGGTLCCKASGTFKLHWIGAS